MTDVIRAELARVATTLGAEGIEFVLERRLRAPDFVKRVAEGVAGYRA